MPKTGKIDVTLTIVNRSKVINCMFFMELFWDVLHVYIKNVLLFLVIIAAILCRTFSFWVVKTESCD